MANLRLMLITNDPQFAKIADAQGVDWVIVDLEKIGKAARQPGMDTVQSLHQIADISAVKPSLSAARLVVRINPLGRHSLQEIDEVIEAGAEILMLPYFKSAQEAETFIAYVGQRAQTCLLVETMEAVAAIEEIVALDGVDYIHVGLNDLHLQRGTRFMFEFLSDGLMAPLAAKIQQKKTPFGFGGVGRMTALKPSGGRLLGEHCRLGSTGVILSRSFINVDAFDTADAFEKSLHEGVKEVREYWRQLETEPVDFFNENQRLCAQEITEVAAAIADRDAS